jgi:hypothetical protein
MGSIAQKTRKLRRRSTTAPHFDKRVFIVILKHHPSNEGPTGFAAMVS